MKYKITKEAWEKLDDSIRFEYVRKGDDYVLNVEDFEGEDVGPLKRAKDRESQGRKEAEERARAAEERLKKYEEENPRKFKDMETLEKHWQGKLEEQKSLHQQELEKREGIINSKDTYIKNSLVDTKAMELANKISTSPNLILPHIKARLTADLDGDSPTTRILGQDGKVSAMNMVELEKEFIDNSDFKSILIGNKASGSGASGDGKNSHRSSGASQSGQTDLTKMSPGQFAEHLKAKREG